MCVRILNNFDRIRFLNFGISLSLSRSLYIRFAVAVRIHFVDCHRHHYHQHQHTKIQLNERLFKRILSAHSFVCVRIYSVLQQHHRKKRQTYARSSIRKLFLTQGFYWYVWLYSMVDTHRWRSMFMGVWARRKYEQPHSRTPCNADGQTDRHQVFVLFPLSYARHTCVHLLSSSHIHQLCECERVHCAYVVVQEFVCPWINGKNNLYFVSVVVLFFSSFFWCVMCGFGIRLCRSIYLYSFLVWCLKWMRFYFSSSCERARVHCVKR